MAGGLKIIVVGETFPASRTVQRIRAFERLGHEVDVVSTSAGEDSYERRSDFVERIRYRLRIPADTARANRNLVKAAGISTNIVWLDNARSIHASTLQKVRQRAPRARLVWYCEDDMMNPRHRTVWIQRAMPNFDLWVTTKSFNTNPEELPRFGVRNFLFVDNTFDPILHRPRRSDDKALEGLSADIAFIGTFEEPRADSMLKLAENRLPVRIWGNGWEQWRGRHPLLRIEGTPIYNDDYARCISATRINLCFLRHFNRDLQTCRSVEIPACGGFMLHERSAEVERLFAPDREAAYFGNDDELVAQCRFWLENEQKRAEVAQAAGRRAIESGLSHDAMLTRALEGALEIPV
ncbi:MAG: glycosyltransferase [Rhodospirillales bacterium]